MANVTFTVFTPTYNRKHTLPRVFDSLYQQTFRDFEWLIVDDGSTDDTQTLVRQWQAKADFPIRYVYQQNRGTHTAYNRGVQEANGELFLPAGSDDAFVPEALERFYHHWQQIPRAERVRFAGVSGHCKDQNGIHHGNYFPSSPLDSDAEEIVFKYKSRGEKWGFARTDVMREFPFPEPEGVKFVPESYVWFRIARRFKMRFINEELRIYFTDGSDRLTGQSRYNIAAGRAFFADTLNFSIRWLPHAPLNFIKIAASYVRYCTLRGDSLATQLGRLDNVHAKFLWLVGWPIGWAVAKVDGFRSKSLSHGKRPPEH